MSYDGTNRVAVDDETAVSDLHRAWENTTHLRASFALQHLVVDTGAETGTHDGIEWDSAAGVIGPGAVVVFGLRPLDGAGLYELVLQLGDGYVFRYLYMHGAGLTADRTTLYLRTPVVTGGTSGYHTPDGLTQTATASDAETSLTLVATSGGTVVGELKNGLDRQVRWHVALLRLSNA